MIARRGFFIFGIAAGILLTGSLGSCSFPIKRLKGDRAFISYWPPPKDSGALRLAVKDLIDIKGEVTTAGSQHFAKRAAPAEADAECLLPARRRNVLFVGKTNLTELALGASGLNEYYGTPRNPVFDESRWMPGGSSSGSAVAVAVGHADVAFGTDTAGSIRTPAACCGVFGLKTTFGLVSLKGVYPISPRHLDTVGPMAKDIPRLVEGMDLLKPGFVQKYQQAVAVKPTGRSIKVGRLYIKGTHAMIDKAVDDALAAAHFKVVKLGAEFEEAWKEATRHGNIIAVADGYANDKHLLLERGVSSTTKAAILLGAVEHESARYREALQARSVWQRQLREVLEEVDVIVLPTLKEHPLRIPLFGRFPLFEARALEMQNTVAVNYAGNPALAVPIPEEERETPASLQVVGPKLSEAELLNVGRIIASKGR